MIARPVSAAVPSALVPHDVSVQSVPARMFASRATESKLLSVMQSSSSPLGEAKAIMKLVPAICW